MISYITIDYDYRCRGTTALRDTMQVTVLLYDLIEADSSDAIGFDIPETVCA